MPGALRVKGPPLEKILNVVRNGQGNDPKKTDPEKKKRREIPNSPRLNLRFPSQKAAVGEDEESPQFEGKQRKEPEAHQITQPDRPAAPVLPKPGIFPGKDKKDQEDEQREIAHSKQQERLPGTGKSLLTMVSH